MAPQALPVYERNFLYATYSILIVASASSGLKVHIVLSLCCTVNTLHRQQDITRKMTKANPKV